MPVLEREETASPSNGDALTAAPRKNGDSNCTMLVERCRLLAGLSPDAYVGMCRVATPKQFTRGEILHFEGDPVEQIMLIASGSAKITKLGRGGDEVILRLKAHGDILGAEGLFSSGMHCTTAETVRTCRAFIWDAKVFKNLVERYPVLHRNMVTILEEHLRDLEDRFREVATNRVGSRVALQLLRLLKSIGRPAKAGMEICLSREEVAQMTGTTLFTVSRLFSAWEERGVVRPRREAVAICDVELLRAISEEV